jgi:hypothetical protein
LYAHCLVAEGQSPRKAVSFKDKHTSKSFDELDDVASIRAPQPPLAPPKQQPAAVADAPKPAPTQSLRAAPPTQPPPTQPPPSQAKKTMTVNDIQDWSFLFGSASTFKESDLKANTYSSASVGARRALQREATLVTNATAKSQGSLSADERKKVEQELKQQMLASSGKKKKKKGLDSNVVLDVSDDEAPATGDGDD